MNLKLAGGITAAAVLFSLGGAVGTQTATDEVIQTDVDFTNYTKCYPIDQAALIAQYDPCDQVKSYMISGFLINLQKLPYFIKWKTANPNEWYRIDTYLSNDEPWASENTLIVNTRTWFGNMIRDTITMCKVALCGSTPLPVVPETVVSNDTTPPEQPAELQIQP